MVAMLENPNGYPTTKRVALEEEEGYPRTMDWEVCHSCVVVGLGSN
jgi:hypothetical protein